MLSAGYKTMDSRQKMLIRQSYALLLPVSEKVTHLLYERLFELDPSLHSLFSSDMGEQGHKLMTTLYTIVCNLDHPEKVVPPLQTLGKRHLSYGVQAAHYDLVGPALLWSLR